MHGHLFTELFAEPGAQLSAEYAKDTSNQNRGHRDQQQKKPFELAMNETDSLFVAVDEVDAVHEQFHDLGATKEHASPAENCVFQNVGTAPGQKIGHDPLASGWQEADAGNL